MTINAASSTSSSTSIRVTFGQALVAPQAAHFVLPNNQAFCDAYNEIVVYNYNKVRAVAALSLLGPAAGVALIVRGSTTSTDNNTTLLLGPLVLLISTLTAVAAVLFLRQLLLEQLQDLCDEYDNAVHLEYDGTQYHLVVLGQKQQQEEESLSQSPQQVFTAVPLSGHETPQDVVVPLVQIV